MNTIRIFVISITMIIISGCSVLSPTATPTPTADREATADAEEALGTQNAEATAEAINTTAEAEATSVALTEAAVTPTIRPVVATRTARADEASGFIQSLFDGGFISTTEGRYLPEGSFSDAEAKINYFFWTYADNSPDNFVFRSDIEWQSASDVANWFNSGCGIVFREDGRGDDFYVVFLTLDGYVELLSWANDNRQSLAYKYYDRLELPNGEAELMVTAEGDHLQVFVNSKLVVDVTDSKHTDGRFAYTVVSGTNKGFGTRCLFENTLLWELDSE